MTLTVHRSCLKRKIRCLLFYRNIILTPFSGCSEHRLTQGFPLLLQQHITETGLTLKATGSVLLHRQWEGRTEHRKLGLSVRTSSAGWSAMISAMLRFSWGRSLGTAAAASGCPAGELTSFIFPGTGWRLLDGGLNLRLALGSTGIRITTAWIIKKGTKCSPAPLFLFSLTQLGEKKSGVSGAAR